MAGHSKFKNIMHRKSSQDQKRSKIFTRLAREISVAAKSGTNIDSNTKLKHAILDAKKYNMPKSKIDQAIHKSSDYDLLKECIYYAYSSEQVPIVIECLTGNNNKTVAEVKAAVGKSGGTFAENLSFLFKKYSFFIYEFENEEDFIEKLLTSNFNDFECIDNKCYATANIEDYFAIKENENLQGMLLESFPKSWIPINNIELMNNDTLYKLLDKINEIDEVSTVWTGSKYIFT